MTPEEHYTEAERLLQPRTVHSIPSGEPRQAPPTTDMILQAQVHATLALYRKPPAEPFVPKLDW